MPKVFVYQETGSPLEALNREQLTAFGANFVIDRDAWATYRDPIGEGLVDCLLAMAQDGARKGADLVIAVSRYAAVYNQQAFTERIRKLSAGTYAVGVMASRISGLGWRHSPRFPIIDPNLIVMNVAIMKNHDFFARSQLGACHLSDVAPVQARLLSWLEHAFLPGEVYDLDDSGVFYDEYGDVIPEFSLPFSIAPGLGVSICDWIHRPRLLRITMANGRASGHTNSRRSRLRTGHYFLEKPFRRKLDRFVSAGFGRLSLRNFQKNYGER